MHKSHTAQITNHKLQKITFLGLFGICILAFGISRANLARGQGSMSITVTPPLFQVSAGPGETWSSSLKLVNTNAYDLTLFATVTGFDAEGEGGHGKFIPIPSSGNTGSGPEVASDGGTLSQWIHINEEPVVIPPQQSREIPFRIEIPENASPGGHYAAILVGTQPATAGEGNRIKISSYVTSLLFLRITGDINEEGSIREFSTERSWNQEPRSVFTLRFENIGNVHLQPQGDLVIYNMWGRERGKIFINERSDFGNVLPKSIRKFVFEWQGEKNLLEAGKYKAVVTLGYGKESRQNISAITYFWVVPVKSILAILGGLGAFILIVSWAIRRYIKKVLELEALRLGPSQAFKQHISAPIQPEKRIASQPQKKMPEPPAPMRAKANSMASNKAIPVTGAQYWSAPITEGIRDLRNIRIKVGENNSPAKLAGMQNKNHPSFDFLSDSPAEFRETALHPVRAQMSFRQYARKYAAVFLLFGVLSCGIAAAFIYFRETLIPARSYELFIHNEDGRKIQIPANQSSE